MAHNLQWWCKWLHNIYFLDVIMQWQLLMASESWTILLVWDSLSVNFLFICRNVGLPKPIPSCIRKEAGSLTFRRLVLFMERDTRIKMNPLFGKAVHPDPSTWVCQITRRKVSLCLRNRLHHLRRPWLHRRLPFYQQPFRLLVFFVNFNILSMPLLT